MPKALMGRPNIILDSGQSVDEAVFMEGFRRWLWWLRKAGQKDGNNPHVYLFYPHKRLHARYGAAPVNKYDEWEVRPVRWDRQMDGHGLLASTAMFEDGVIWKGRETGDPFDSPWRTNGAPEVRRKRAAVVYLNPTRQDIDYGAMHSDYWHDGRRIPVLCLGQPSRSMPRWALHECAQVLVYSREYADKVNLTMGRQFAMRLPWGQFWEPDIPRHFITAAPDWRHSLRHRWPALVSEWASKKGWECYAPANNGTWEEVAEATSCRFYIIASTAETVPFDALIAYARGATVVAPDVGVFREIFHKKWLYPVHESGNHALAWTQAEVREWLYLRMEKEDTAWQKSPQR